jgi:hypothetical protein
LAVARAALVTARLPCSLHPLHSACCLPTRIPNTISPSAQRLLPLTTPPDSDPVTPQPPNRLATNSPRTQPKTSQKALRDRLISPCPTLRAPFYLSFARALFPQLPAPLSRLSLVLARLSHQLC